eukprot:g11316.t1
MELDSHALLRINAHEDAFLPVEVKVGWLTSQASMRSRASAMVGNRISQLDDAIRVRALLCIIRSAAPSAPTETTTTPPPSVPSTTPLVGAAAGAAGAASQNEQPDKETQAHPREASSNHGKGAGAQEPRGRGHVRTDSATERPPAPADLELFTRMAVANLKKVLFQLASDAERKERQGKDVFDVYEGLVTTEALEKAAEAGFPALDVDTILLPKHFRYRSLVAARHRYLLRKLGVLLDMEDGVEALLELAADTETLRDSLADVDLSSGEAEDGEGDGEDGEDEAEEERVVEPLRKGSAASLSASSVLMSPSCNAAAAAAAAVSSTGGGASGAAKAKAIPKLRDTSWDKDMGNEDTTEGETDEESANGGTPQVVHRRTVEVNQVEVPPSH